MFLDFMDAIKILFENPEYGYLTIGTIAAFVMALLRCLRFDRRDLSMVITESIMCAMIAGSIVMGVRAVWSIAFIWAVPIGVAVGFIGTNFIHLIIKQLIEFQLGRFTGGRPFEDRGKQDYKNNNSR